MYHAEEEEQEEEEKTERREEGVEGLSKERDTAWRKRDDRSNGERKKRVIACSCVNMMNRHDEPFSPLSSALSLFPTVER